tara:strand:+ start:1332 stop:1727 length:396 start_codon:yes stop_codon:yes gene_type:complete
MQQFLIAIIVILGIASWWLYSENQVLTMNNIQLESAVKQQEEAIAAIKENYEKQGKALNQLTSRNAQIEAEMNGYLDIFRRHNLNKLAIAKPGMIETRANDQTKAVFESIENDSKELDSLDDPSTDINPNN